MRTFVKDLVANDCRVFDLLKERLTTVPFTKFESNTSEHLGQLFVTPEMIANKIKKMKIINHLELMGYHQNCLRKLLSKLVHHLQNCLTCRKKE